MTEPTTDPTTEPTPEQIAERARRADRGTRGAMAAVLGLEMVVVLLIPRTIAFTTGLGPVRSGICFGVAGLLLVGAAVTRRAWGIAYGSVMQVVFIATGFLIATMFLLGIVFAAIWLRLLMLRHDIVGSPGGLRLFAG